MSSPFGLHRELGLQEEAVRLKAPTLNCDLADVVRAGSGLWSIGAVLKFHLLAGPLGFCRFNESLLLLYPAPL